MKIAHLSVTRNLTQGQKKQLRFECDSSSSLEGVEWRTYAYHNGVAEEKFIKRIPLFFRPIFFRNLYGWLIALHLSKYYDFVLMRHMTFDPFVLFFAPFIKNRITVHHAKEIEELRLIRKGWKGHAAATLERLSGRISVRNAVAVLGVTAEIAEYERYMHAPGKKVGVYSNGVDLDQVMLLKDSRVDGVINIAFICGTFSDWHGLDKLVNSVDDHKDTEDSVEVFIHLIGYVSDEQRKSLTDTERRRKIFKTHGLMSEVEYRQILEQCDVGITSLALERKGLREASTLKVREMLAMGLSIYSGHEDVALDTKLPFIKVVNNASMTDLIDFSLSTKKLSREFVREKSAARISKSAAMERAVENISSWTAKCNT